MTPPHDDLAGVDDFIAEHALARRARPAPPDGRWDVVRAADHTPAPAVRVRRVRLPRSEYVYVHSTRRT